MRVLEGLAQVVAPEQPGRVEEGVVVVLVGFTRTRSSTPWPQAFAALLAGHLAEASEIERLGADARVLAARLSATWQGHVLDRTRPDTEWLTAAQVAARYGVTPQAVYKWIRADRVTAEQTPGGSWRLPADQFARDRTDPRRLAALQAKLVEHVGEAAPVSDKDLTDEIVSRRQS